jgi:hypothetical protein
MAKYSLALAASVIAFAIALFAPALTARAQSGARFEYLRVVEYYTAAPTLPLGRIGVGRLAYRACVAASPDWTCRNFEPTENTDDALRMTLFTLGNDGWELVSAVDDTPERDNGLTYVFKRQQR